MYTEVSISKTETDWKCQEEGLETFSKNRGIYPQGLKVCQKSIQFLAVEKRAPCNSYDFNVTALE